MVYTLIYKTEYTDKGAHMKILIAGLILIAPTIAGAWEVPGNPDRFPSVGLNIGNGELSGPRYESDLPGTSLNRNQGGHEKNFFHSLGADVRVPIHQSVTLSFSYDALDSDNHYSRQSNGQSIYETSNNLSGYRYGIGLRLYLNNK